MSTNRSLEPQLPKISFAPAVLPAETVRYLQGALPNDSADTYAEMLPADHRAMRGREPHFLVTLFLADRTGAFHALLKAMRGNTELFTSWRVRDFNVVSSLSASLAGVGAAAVVVQPTLEDRNRPLTDAEIEQLRVRIERHLRLEFQSHAAWSASRSTKVTADAGIVVRRIEPQSDFGLYAGREFREVRFRLSDDRESAAEQCVRTLQRFATALAEKNTPLAFLHYPLYLRSPGPAHSRWLRIAYAVDRPSRDIGIEFVASEIATDEEIALSVYDPTLPGRNMDERFTSVVEGPPTSTTNDVDNVEPPIVGEALCILGIARVGLVARIMSDLPGARIYGVTMAVLFGHTVCNVVVDPGTAEVLTARFPDDYMVIPQSVDPNRPLVSRSASDTFTFWVAWRCRDTPGVLQGVIAAVYETFSEAGVEPPNLDYAITRVIADASSCGGKIKFVCSVADALRVRLVDGPAVDTGRDNVELPGWSALRANLRQVVDTALDNWQPSVAEWRGRPVVVGDAEPHEQPWARLVVPEGTRSTLDESRFVVEEEQRAWKKKFVVPRPAVVSSRQDTILTKLLGPSAGSTPTSSATPTRLA